MDEVLNMLEIIPTFPGALGSFLNDMRSKGKCDIEFRPDAIFSKAFGLTEPVYEFKTHQDLDKFTSQLLAKDATFKISYVSEYQLLKSFDRAFWYDNFCSLQFSP